MRFITLFSPVNGYSCLNDILHGSVICDIDNDILIQTRNIKASDYKLPVYEQVNHIKNAMKKCTNNYCISKAYLYLSEYLDKFSLFLLRQKSAKYIQNKWRLCINNPEYYLCKKRLLKEYNELL